MKLPRTVFPSLVVIVASALPTAHAQDEPTLIQSDRAPRAPSAPAAPAPPRIGAPFVEDGMSCLLIDFEGVGNKSPIPEFDGISSPDWLGIIDADAGGTGNFAFEPSPQTISFWLQGDPSAHDILIETPAGKVEFFYASFVTSTVEAYDGDGNLLDSAIGPPNWDQGPGGDPTGNYNQWDPIAVEATDNVIERVRVSGNANQTGIDDLKVCWHIQVAAVEMTQAIQEYQPLPDLVAELADDGEPPVPILAGKPGVMRIYHDVLRAITPVEIRVVVPDLVDRRREFDLQAECGPKDQRIVEVSTDKKCPSADFYFTPPKGDWTATVELFDEQGNLLESHELPFSSREPDRMILKAVSVCDTKSGSQWTCSAAEDIVDLVDFLRRTAPTDEVKVEVTKHQVKEDTATHDDNSNGVLDGDEDVSWWGATVHEIHGLYGLFDGFLDLFGSERFYYGMVRDSLDGGIGGAAWPTGADPPSRGAASRSTVVRLGQPAADETLAHEVGHMLGRPHTNTDKPKATNDMPPGCYNKAVDGGTDWPFGDNKLQSSNDLEVGFDVTERKPVAPDVHYDWMSYCIPRWISPHTYLNALSPLEIGLPLPDTIAVGDFWVVSGRIEDGQTHLDPIYLRTIEGDAGFGSGTHRLQVEDTTGSVLSSRSFTPASPRTETQDDEASLPQIPSFHELLPHDPAATRIVLLDDQDTELAAVDLVGTTPTPTLLFPLGGETLSGPQTVSWSIDDADGPEHWSRVEYTWDGGATWASLGQVRGTTLEVDFDLLPGSTEAARVRVLVSDGANSGTAESGDFTVPGKLPTAEILLPVTDDVFYVGDGVQLQASAYDVDDDFLDGSDVVWTSDLDGEVATGASASLTNLSAGEHQLTLTATDSDGNQASATTSIFVGGARPTVDLEIEILDTLPTTCVKATIDAAPGATGAELATVEFSLDTGETWSPVDLDLLPLSFVVPGEGFVHFVARAFDEADQVAAEDATFFIETACSTDLAPFVAVTAPDDDAILPSSSPIDFAGYANDFPDGDLSADLLWSTNLAGSIGSGAAFSATLAPGPHLVTAQVQDGGGKAGSDQIRVAVTSPQCPAEVVLAGDTITGAETHRAVNDVVLGPDLTVAAGGELTLIANRSVVFEDGFEVLDGGALVVEMAVNPCE